MQAWSNQAVQATKGSKENPKPKYSKFQDFYDHEKEFERIINGDKPEVRKSLSLADRNRLLNRM